MKGREGRKGRQEGKAGMERAGRNKNGEEKGNEEKRMEREGKG